MLLAKVKVLEIVIEVAILDFYKCLARCSNV
jgi:hypothetical protein